MILVDVRLRHATVNGEAADVVVRLPRRAAVELVRLGLAEASPARPAPAPVQTAAVTAPEKRGGAKS